MSVELEKAIRKFKKETIGAGCFKLKIVNEYFCANGLTKKQAEKFATENEITLIKWEAGKTCSQIQCG